MLSPIVTSGLSFAQLMTKMKQTSFAMLATITTARRLLDSRMVQEGSVRSARQ